MYCDISDPRFPRARRTLQQIRTELIPELRPLHVMHAFISCLRKDNPGSFYLNACVFNALSLCSLQINLDFVKTEGYRKQRHPKHNKP